MSITIEKRESDWLIRLEDTVNVTSAEKLKSVLLETLASGKDLQLDLERVEEIDVTVMQLLWAAGREADRDGKGIVFRVSKAAAAAAREIGFERFPGTTIQE